MALIDPRVETLALLKSIDASLKTLIRMQSGGSQSCPPVASDADLDGQYGNPEVRAKDPRDWTGEPMKGRRFSECPAAYLDMLAERFDFFAGQETDAKKAGYCRKDAARARGWAQRIRDGRVPAMAGATSEDATGWGDDLTAVVSDWD